MRRGPLYMTAAGLMFTVMVTLVKIARRDMEPVDLMFWRCLTAVPIAALFAYRLRMHLRRIGLLAVRTLFGFGAMMGFFHATHGLSVANLSLIHKLHPILVAIVAPLALGASERGGAFTWGLLIAGLGGCALILAPDLAVGSTYGLIALLATISSACAHTCIRALTRDYDSRLIVLYFQIGVTALSALYIVATTGGGPAIPEAALWPHVLGIGVTATAGQLLMTQAYAEDRAAVVAAASYTTPLWGVIADLLIFDLIPGSLAIVGGVIIVAAGLVLIFSRERPAADIAAEEA